MARFGDQRPDALLSSSPPHRAPPTRRPTICSTSATRPSSRARALRSFGGDPEQVTEVV